MSTKFTAQHFPKGTIISTSIAKTKAQINTPCKYRVLTDAEVNHLFKP